MCVYVCVCTCVCVCVCVRVPAWAFTATSEPRTCVDAMRTAAAVVKAEMTGWEMKFMMKPMRKRPMNSCMMPEMSAIANDS